MTLKTAFSMIMVDERYPQKLQHVYIDHFLKRLGYVKSFYGAETELTKIKNDVLIHHLENKIEGDAIVFFSLEQLKDSENKINYSLMNKILKSGYDLIIAMQEICLLSSGDHNLSSIFINEASLESRSLRKLYKDNLL